MRHFDSFFKGNLVLLLLFICSGLQAQWILVNDTGGTVHGSAALQIESKSQGFLFPRMESADRLGIASPATGLLVYQSDGDSGFYFYDGVTWDTLANASKINSIVNLSKESIGPSNSNIVTVRDIKSMGTGGGTFTSGSWQKRELNDLSGDQSFISLEDDTMRLDSGIYFIRAFGPAYRVNSHQIRLYNASIGSIEAVGTVVRTVIATASSDLMVIVEVNSSSNDFIIEHRCETTWLNQGLGIPNSWGNNVYTQVQIKKLE